MGYQPNGSFCRLCGKALVEVPTGFFNSETGAPSTGLACPASCEHGWHSWVVTEPKGVLGRLFGARVKCALCGTAKGLDAVGPL